MVKKILRFAILFLAGALLKAQSSTTAEALGYSAHTSKILAGSLSTSIPFMVDSVGDLTIEIIEGTPCTIILISPTGNSFNLSANGGMFSGLSYSVTSDTTSGSRRLMVEMTTPQPGIWQAQFSLSNPALVVVPCIVSCYFDSGPKVLATFPRVVQIGGSSEGSVAVLDNNQLIQPTVTASIIMANDPQATPRALNVSFDGLQYLLDLSSQTSQGDYVITYTVSGIGSTGPFFRNGSQLIKVLQTSATYGGQFSTSYNFSYGNR